jgi:hypothetical protein
MVFFGLMGHALLYGNDLLSLTHELKQACDWAAVTCIVRFSAGRQ